MSTMGAKETETLRKVHALTSSASKGEAASARARLAALVKKRGKTMADLPAILDPPMPVARQSALPPSFADIFDRVDDEMERHQPGYKAERAAKKAAAKREAAELRADLIAKFGSKEAAIAPNAMEQAVNDAVKPFARRDMFKYANGTFPRNSLDGWTSMGDGPPPEHVVAAVCAALPIPKTITEAKAEWDAWQRFDTELGAVYGDTVGNEQLSLGCSLRNRIIEAMIHKKLRACSVAEALIRHKAVADREFQPSDDEASAMLADLEHLAALEQARGTPSPAVKRPEQRRGNTAQTETDF